MKSDLAAFDKSEVKNLVKNILAPAMAEFKESVD
jgi:hypothetical protein